MNNNRIEISSTLLCFISIMLVTVLPIDYWLADLFYYLEGGSWALRDNWITENLIHTGGRKLAVFFAIILIVLIITSFFYQTLKPYRVGLIYILITAVIATTMISILKTITHRDCPWDLMRYGGENPIYTYFFYGFTPGIRNGACFPAGHASAGYCWFGLYFFSKRFFPGLSNISLAIPLLMGLIYGIDQQLRGAHFLSHDIWSAWICWFFAYSLSFMLNYQKTANKIVV